jgi:hypothetical protein
VSAASARPPSALATALLLGVRFAVGSRAALGRSLLTALGIGVCVAALLLAAAVPNALAARDARASARSDSTFGDVALQAGPGTLLVGDASMSLDGLGVRGRLLLAEGPQAPVPPGLDALPLPGTVAVSPALAEALADPAADTLRARLPYEVVATIGPEGLLGPRELAFYAGDDRLQAERRGLEQRIDAFGSDAGREPLDGVLLMLLVVGVSVLLLPMLMFVSVATRLGTERRDRRLAALRLLGVDATTARATAAVEAALSATAGLVVGAVLFLLGRQALQEVSVLGLSVFPHDVRPVPVLLLAAVVLVPGLAVVSSLLGLRGVALEPLGVVRQASRPRRRLWWRLLLPGAGAALLAVSLRPLPVGDVPDTRMITAGTVMILCGLLALLPWLVDVVVLRLGRGRPSAGGGRVAVAWQLAVRRLQNGGSTSSRVVSGVTVAAAGAIALQMLFAGLADNYATSTGADLSRAEVVASTLGLTAEQVDAATTAVGDLDETARVLSTTTAALTVAGQDVDLVVGDCEALAELAEISACRDGDVYLIDSTRMLTGLPGETGRLSSGTAVVVPASATTVPARLDPTGMGRDGAVLATPAAVDLSQASGLRLDQYALSRDGSPRGLAEAMVTALLEVDPLPVVRVQQTAEESNRFAGIRTGLTVGGLVVLLAIGASLLVSGLDQVAERRQVHAVLHAMGTPAGVLSGALVFGSLIPVALGTALAVLTGIGLGALLLTVTGSTIVLDPLGIGLTAATSGLVVLLVSAGLIPSVQRSDHRGGLRSE